MSSHICSTPKINKFILLAFLLTAARANADTIKVLIPSKDWQLTIECDLFKPWEVLNQSLILGGRTADGIEIKIFRRKTAPNTNPRHQRKDLTETPAFKSGQRQIIEQLEVNGIAVLIQCWVNPSLPGFNASQLAQAKERARNKWIYHGFVVKDDTAFEIRFIADITRHKRETLVDIFKSFRIGHSPEAEDYKKLDAELVAPTGSDATGHVTNRLQLVTDFAQKYPNNPEAQVLLGDYYFDAKKLPQAQQYYEKALQNHQTQPISNPRMLLAAHENLAHCYNASGKHEPAVKNLKSAYKIVWRIAGQKQAGKIAYKLARVLAAANDSRQSLKYLRESIDIDLRVKEKAKADPAFETLRRSQRFKEIVSKDYHPPTD